MMLQILIISPYTPQASVRFSVAIEKLWIKRVSSHFPESQSYYSTLAKLMMKQDLDLSADDDVHSWLDALNERELSRLRKNFLRN